MDAFIDSTIQLLIEWGLPGLFISALLAGSIVPFSSELVLVAGETRSAPDSLSDLRHSGQHSRRNDLLLYGTSGQNQLDPEIFQGKERESRQNGEIPARKRSIDGLLHLSSRYWGSDSHCTGIYAKQHMAHHSFHVCRQTDTLYSSPVCTRKCLGRYSRVRILNIR